jgi:ABC-type Fe3+-citrate transport system substrate-binding protein
MGKEEEENRKKKKKHSLWDLWDIIKYTKVSNIRVHKNMWKKGSYIIYDEMMAGKIPKCHESCEYTYQEVQRYLLK